MIGVAACIKNLLASGGGRALWVTYCGMQTFDQHLVGRLRDGVTTMEAAMSASTSPHDFTVELRRLGLVA